MDAEKQDYVRPGEDHGPTQKDQGMCRICYDLGGELVAPCLCKGTARWVHRDCLNSWRATATNAQALTNCRECGFQYLLEDQNVYGGLGSPLVRQVARRLALNTCVGFCTIQLLIFTLGWVIRACDRKERLVQQYNGIPEEEYQVEGFFHAVRFHAKTYYISSIYCWLLITGFPVFCYTLYLIAHHMYRHGCRSIPAEFAVFVLCPMPCPGASVAAMAMFSLIFFEILGAVFLLLLLTFVVQWMWGEYVKVYELSLVANRYMVVDLAVERNEDQAGEEGGRPEPPPVSDQQLQLEIRRHINSEVSEICGRRAAMRDAAATVYGSAGFSESPPPPA